jgi:hypothetical protein
LSVYVRLSNLLCFILITDKVNYEPKVSSLEDVELEVDDAELNKMLTDT